MCTPRLPLSNLSFHITVIPTLLAKSKDSFKLKYNKVTFRIISSKLQNLVFMDLPNLHQSKKYKYKKLKFREFVLKFGPLRLLELTPPINLREVEKLK